MCASISQEVNLIRPKENQKLGLTLCDEVDVYNNQIKVVVKHVSFVDPIRLLFICHVIANCSQL